MVRYSREHKEETRRRIVAAAARAYREEGVSGVGIGELMQGIGLTHGGFYAHFDSKDALVAEACDSMRSPLAERYFAWAEEAGGAEGLRRMIRGYVSRQHRDDPGLGCLMPALAADVSRSAPEVRASFTRSLRRLLDGVARLLPGGRPASAAPEVKADDAVPDEALVLVSGMVGAVLLARAADDPELSDRILLAARRFYMESFASEEEAGNVGEGRE